MNAANSERLDPAHTALVVFDLLECYRQAAEAAGVIEPVRRLILQCRARGVALAWARADHRADGLDFARTVTDTDSKHRPWGPDNPPPTAPPYGSGSPMYRSLAELGQSEEDYDVPKHRWSAFHGTHLDTSLRVRNIDTILLVGGSTHVGVASTAYDARDMDYQIVVVRDGLTGQQPQRDFFADHVFPRMCRVRTSDEVLAMFDRTDREE
ncbi:MAG: isochorismatase family protein [Actinophytocola sp.]|nr:isochorismatase family protein [Actinophytocola sp.]